MISIVFQSYFNPTIILSIISVHLLLIALFHWYAIALLSIFHGGFSYGAYYFWRSDIANKRLRTDPDCPSAEPLPRLRCDEDACKAKTKANRCQRDVENGSKNNGAVCPFLSKMNKNNSSSSEMGSRPHSRCTEEDVKRDESSINMNHIFIPFSLYLSVCYTVGLNAAFKWVFNSLLLAVRQFLHKWNIITVVCCDYHKKAADLVLNSLQAIHFNRIFVDSKGNISISTSCHSIPILYILSCSLFRPFVVYWVVYCKLLLTSLQSYL